jgi:hypothetical protein
MVKRAHAPPVEAKRRNERIQRMGTSAIHNEIASQRHQKHVMVDRLIRQGIEVVNLLFCCRSASEG